MSDAGNIHKVTMIQYKAQEGVIEVDLGHVPSLNKCIWASGGVGDLMDTDVPLLILLSGVYK